MSRAKEYPPPGHLIRRLDISLVPDAHDTSVMYTSMPLTPQLFVDGRFRLAVVAIMVDMAAGLMAVRSVTPDWTATFDMASHRIGEAEPGAKADGVTRLVRAGKNIVVSETTVTVHGAPIVYAETTFSRLPHREGTAASVPLDTPRYLGQGEVPLPGPIAEVIGFRTEREGTIGFELSDLIRNSTGSVQGGVSGVAMEQAALSLEGGGSGLDFLHVYYLAASKGGPYQAAAQALRHTNHGVTGRVELKDLHNDRLLCQGTFLSS